MLNNSVPSLAIARSARSKSVARRIPLSWLIFGVTFAIYAFTGWIGAFVLETYNYDGIARIAQAFGVLYSRDPQLAAIGFVWMPLPVLSDLPLVWLLKPFGWVLWAGPLMSAFYTALALATFYNLLGDFEIPRAWRIVWVIGLGAHPLIMHDGAMGLSEAPLLAFLLLALRGFIAWDQAQQNRGVLEAGIWSALAIFCRYEVLAWVGVMSLAILWRCWLDPLRRQQRMAQASLLAYITPSVYALSGWVIVNWLIMGNPIYFLVGPGSTSTTPDTAQAVGPSHPFAYAQNSVPGSMLLMERQIAELAPLILFASIFLLSIILWKKRWTEFSYLALGWSILGFTLFAAWRGLLPAFSRYFFWSVPGGMIVAAVAFRNLIDRWARALTVLVTTLILVAPSAWLFSRALDTLPEPYPLRVIGALVMPPEVTDYHQVRGQIAEMKAIAAYLNTQSPTQLTILDATVGSPLIFFIDHPEKLVLTTDRDFKQILVAPVGRVDQVLVPYPSFDAQGRSEILKLYPTIYDGQFWTRFMREFPGQNAWRLYQVIGP